MNLTATPQGNIEATLALEKGTLRLRAADLRKERTGVHGRLTIAIGSTMLAWSSFNLERDEDRRRLSNSAHRLLSSPKYPKGQDFPADDLRHNVDLFCANVWDTHLQQFTPTYLKGDSLTPINFIAKPHVLDAGGTIKFGPGGGGKSYTVILEAICIDAGQNHYWETTQTKVLFVNLERSAKSIERRIGLVNCALGLDPERPLLTLNARGKSLRDVQEGVRRAVDKEGVGLLVLDSLSRAGSGDLKDDQPTNRVCDLLNDICPSWLAIGHTPRSDTTHVYGSVMYENAADLAVRCISERNGKEIGIKLEVTKANDTDIPPPMWLAYTFDDFGLHSIRHSSAKEFPNLASDRKRSRIDRIIEYLQLVSEASSIKDISENTGIDRGDVSTTVKANLDKLVKVGSGRSLVVGLRATNDSQY